MLIEMQMASEHTEKDILHVQNVYFTVFYYAAYVRTVVTVLGFLMLYVYMSNKSVPVFINWIAACTFGASLVSLQYAEISYEWIVTKTALWDVHKFHKWALPLRLYAFVLTSISHWIFAVQYFHLALYMPIMIGKGGLGSVMSRKDYVTR